jgi:hypothetical protein
MTGVQVVKNLAVTFSFFIALINPCQAHSRAANFSDSTEV